MKAGERKRFLVTDPDGKDMIPFMKWTTHDKHTVMISSDFVDEKRTIRNILNLLP